jgi:hypothetical protein
MNKGELKSAVLDTLVRQDLSGRPIVDTWVQAATARLNQELLLNAQVARASLVSTGRLVELPADFISAKSVRVTNGAFGAVKGNLEYQPPEEINDMAVIAMGGHVCGLPMFYTTIGQRMELAPWRAGSNFNIELWYYRLFPDLVTDEDTNFILNQYPQLYLNLTCSMGHQFLLENDNAMSREAMAMAEIQRLMMRKDAEKYGDGPLIVRPTRRIGGRFS